MSEPDIPTRLRYIADEMSAVVDAALSLRDEAKAVGLPTSGNARAALVAVCAGWVDVATRLQAVVSLRMPEPQDEALNAFEMAVTAWLATGQSLESAMELVRTRIRDKGTK